MPVWRLALSRESWVQIKNKRGTLPRLLPVLKPWSQFIVDPSFLHRVLGVRLKEDPNYLSPASLLSGVWAVVEPQLDDFKVQC